VSSLFFKNREGQTPLDESMRDDLIPGHVQDMTELYELESENIALGIAWSRSTSKDHKDQAVWLELHKRMLDEVWSFAGSIRKKELQNTDFLKPFQIRVALRELESDLKSWLEFKSYPPREMMAIFHEKLLTIHPFRDGNGRWSRVLVQFVSKREEFEQPSWGQVIPDDETRRQSYILAIKSARGGDYTKLIKFMYS
jgi:Fic-DOC domain mobile mystery protein B